MLCVRIIAKPLKGHPQFWELGAASCNLFVDTEDENTAIEEAEEYLTNYHWETESLTEVSPVKNPQDFAQDEELLKLYRTAKVHGVSAMIVACPTGGEISDLPPESV